jgi:hypothetical protein
MLKLMKQYSLWSHIKASSLALLGTLVWGGFTPSLAIGYQSVMFGGNYLGGPSFDDNLSLSALALAQNFDKWGNWDLSGSKKNRLFVTWYGSIGEHKSTKSLSGKRLN